MTERFPGSAQFDYDNQTPEDEEHREQIRQRKQEREDARLDEAGL